MPVPTFTKPATGAVADARKSDLPLPAYAGDQEPAGDIVLRTVTNYLRHEIAGLRDLSVHAPAVAERISGALSRHGADPIRVDELVTEIALALRDEAGIDYMARGHARVLAAALAPLFVQSRPR